jgi:integrase
MDRGELGRFLFTAERLDRAHAALAVLLGLNGLRVSEACATNIEDLGLERGHRTLRIVGKGNKPAVIPLVPRTARTIDLAIGERNQGPILRRSDGQRLDRRTAHRWVRSIGKRAGLTAVRRHMLRAGFIWRRLTRASHSETSRPLLVIPTHEPPRSMTGDGRTSTAALLTSSSRLSPRLSPDESGPARPHAALLGQGQGAVMTGCGRGGVRRRC